MEVGKADTLGGQPAHIGRFYHSSAAGTHIAVAEAVHIDKQYVGPLG